MELQTHTNTPAQLAYRIHYGVYGFANGEWFFVHKNKVYMPVAIKIIDDPNTDERYQMWLDKLYEPLNENF